MRGGILAASCILRSRTPSEMAEVGEGRPNEVQIRARAKREAVKQSAKGAAAEDFTVRTAHVFEHFPRRPQGQPDVPRNRIPAPKPSHLPLPTKRPTSGVDAAQVFLDEARFP